jgi:hypothetical protein
MKLRGFACAASTRSRQPGLRAEVADFSRFARAGRLMHYQSDRGSRNPRRRDA